VLAPAEGVLTGLPEMDYALEIVGLRIKPLYNVPVKHLYQGSDRDRGATP
jgi:hypothetical protein